MTARSVYFKSPNVRDLLKAQNAFFTQYQVQGLERGRPGSTVTLFKIDTIINPKTEEYETFITIDMPVGNIGARLDQVDNTRFNVSTPEEEKEIAEEKARQQAQAQQQAIPMSA